MTNSNNKVPDAVVKAVVDFWGDACEDEDDVRADIEKYFGGVVPPKDAPIWDDEQYFIDLFNT